MAKKTLEEEGFYQFTIKSNLIEEMFNRKSIAFMVYDPLKLCLIVVGVHVVM